MGKSQPSPKQKQRPPLRTKNDPPPGNTSRVESEYRCNICDNRYKTVSKLRKHHNKRHPGEEERFETIKGNQAEARLNSTHTYTNNGSKKLKPGRRKLGPHSKSKNTDSGIADTNQPGVTETDQSGVERNHSEPESEIMCMICVSVFETL